MSLPTHFTLNNGLQIPSLGLGTWQSPKGQVRDAVCAALKNGYRHIDCAWGYQNEGEVGEGIRMSGVPRSEIWITSKLFEFHHSHVKQACQDSLNRLGLDYLDLYLMHWNVALVPDVPADGSLPQKPLKESNGKPKVDVELSNNPLPVWRDLEKLVDEGLVKSIGVSNFNIRRLQALLKDARIKPVANQVELSFTCPQPDLLAYLKSVNILAQAYSPLGSTGASHTSMEVIDRLAKKHNVEGANILISWQVGRGANPLPKSVTASRIKNNAKLVPLTVEELRELEEEANKQPFKKVCDQSEDFGYDIYEASHPQNNDKAQWALLSKASSHS